jgi:predicted double-glycine peptidase
MPGSIEPRIVLRQATALVCAVAAFGASPSSVVVNTGTVREEIRVKSLREQRDAGVVKQGYDYSCGAASLATLLSYGLNDEVREDTLLRALIEPLSPDGLAALQHNGLSLFDLQHLAKQRGHKAQGFRISQNQLSKLSVPVIVFIKPHGYLHFAVFKGVRGERVHIADPSLGNVRMPLYRFLDMWADTAGNGVIFAVEKADGSWPDHFALQLHGSSEPPLEVLSAERMREIATPFPFHLPK